VDAFPQYPRVLSSAAALAGLFRFCDRDHDLFALGEN